MVVTVKLNCPPTVITPLVTGTQTAPGETEALVSKAKPPPEVATGQVKRSCPAEFASCRVGRVAVPSGETYVIENAVAE